MRGCVSIAGVVVALASSCSGADTESLGDITYSEDIQWMLQAKCGPCHTGEGFGDTNFAVSYGDLFLASQRCPGQRVFECVPEQVQSGAMPPNVGCTGDPAVDVDDTSCLSSAELDLLMVWAAEGAPE